MSLRDIKRKGRRDLHNQMKVPALYIVPGTNAMVPCEVRVHSEWKALGGVGGTSFAYAEREERPVEIIFWRDQVQLPVRNAIISVEPGEAYVLDAAKAPDDQTITAYATAMTPADAAAYPVPDNHAADYAAILDPAIFQPRASTSTYLKASLNGPTPTLTAGEAYVVPVSQTTLIDDARKGAYQDHDFFEGDRLRALALDDQFFVRIDLTVVSAAMTNSVDLKFKTGETQETTDLGVSQPVTPGPSGDSQKISLFTRVYAREVFLATGAALEITFQQDTEIVDMEIYISQ